MVTALDPRLNAFRPDLADERLAGRVEASRFVAGSKAHVVAPLADIRHLPDGSIDSQILFGDAVRVFERADGWAWIQAMADGYCGYVRVEALADGEIETSHVVGAPRSFVYPDADLRTPPLCALSMGSNVAIRDFRETRGTRYGELVRGGYVFAGHLVPPPAPGADPVDFAELMLATPYLWGGASAFGIDCSGLVQLSMRMAGRRVLRDSDMQQGSIGSVLPAGAHFRRGDLVFWKGHVAIFADAQTLVHASGHSMQVVREPLAVALDRIGRSYGAPQLYRRP